MDCIRGNRKRLAFDEDVRRRSDDIDVLANEFYRRHRVRHTIFWRSFDVLRHSFIRANQKSGRSSERARPHKTTPTNDIDILRGYEPFSKQNDMIESKTRRKTFDSDKLTYGLRDITLSTDWVIISEISDKNNGECHRRR